MRLLSSVGLALASITSATLAQAASFTVIADGLDNPRGLSFAPDGSLYVTEAGVGGEGRCVPGPSLEGLLSCAGTSGAVTRITDTQQRVLTDLPSVALQPTGNIAAGPHDIQFDAAGTPYLLIGYAGSPDPSVQDFPPGEPSWGQLYRVDLSTGSLTSLANYAQYELNNNPDGGVAVDVVGEIASNPYAIAIKDDTAYMVDAAANDLLSVGLDGSNLATVAVLPTQAVSDPIFPPPAPGQELPPAAPPAGAVPPELVIESVPTGVVVGPDGALYVSEYTGFPFPKGEARIFRVTLDGEVSVYADGFTQLIDLAFDNRGNLLALQYADRPEWTGDLEGSIVQVAPDGTQTTLVDTGLLGPTALAVGEDGAIYVSNRGDRSQAGQVLRIEQSVPEPVSVLALLAFGSAGACVKRKHQEVK